MSPKLRFALAILGTGFLLMFTGDGAQPVSATHTATGDQALLGVLLYCESSTSPCYRGAAALGTTSSWDKDIFSADDFPEVRCCDLLLPRPITDKLWFLLGFDYNTAYGRGMALRTTDGGLTWSSFSRPETNHVWQDFASDAYGRLWGISHDETTTFSGSVKVWHSDDGGNNWEEDFSEVDTCGTTRMYRIVTHPTDPLRLAIYGRTNLCVFGHDHHRVTLTTDGGQSWTTKTSAQFGPRSTGHEADLVMTPSGRLILAGEIGRVQESGPIRSIIITSDNNGESWTLAKDFGNSASHRNLGPVGKVDGSALYVVHTHTSTNAENKVWQSIDQGATWAALNNNVPQNNVNDKTRGGIAYDPVEDAIYVANEVGIFDHKLVMKMSPPSLTGTWQDVSYNLLPFGPDPTERYGIADYGQHIAVTPARRRSANGHGGSSDNPGAIFANGPVNVTNGNEFHQHTDLVIPGRGVPLEFTRAYNSGDPRNGPLGYGWTFNYDMRLEIDRADPNRTEVTRFSPGGGSALFLENPDGSYSAPPGVFETLTENGDQTFVLTSKAQIRYQFDGNGRLTSITDRNNNTTNLVYTTGLLTVTDPGGRSLVIEYDGLNRVKKVTDPLSRTVEFTYDPNGDLWKVKDVKAHPVNGPLVVYTYENHRLRFITDVNNGPLAWENVYDAAGRVVEQRDRVGSTTCFYYGTLPAYTSQSCPVPDPAPKVNETMVRDPSTNTTTYVNDGSGRTTAIKDAQTPPGVVEYLYDANGNPTCVTDQRQKKTAYSYDAMGNVTEVIDAQNTDANCQLKIGGVKSTYAYTSLNDIDLESDPLGRQTDYIYDAAGNLTRIARKEAAGGVKALTCFERDTSGQPNGWGQITATVESTDLNTCTGNRTLFGYDTYGNQTCVVNARHSASPACAWEWGTKATSIFDLGGRLRYSTDEITNYWKPVRGTMPEIGSQCGPAGSGNGVDDDDDPNDDSVADDGCASVKFMYDAQNNLLAAVDDLGNTTTNTYDAKGNLKTVTDANNKITTYNYDNADRLIEVVDALNQKTSFGYDPNGNRAWVTNGRAAVRPVGANGPETFAQCGLTGLGNGVNEDSAADDGIADDGCPSTFHAYDALNRLQSSIDALGRVTTYQYDAASNLTQMTDARGWVTKYFPDDLGRLDLLEHWNGPTLIDSVDYTHNAVGFRTQMADSTGTTSYTPDALDRLTSVTFPGPQTVGYTYDDLPGGAAADYPGQRTKITYPDSKTVSYTYEPDGSMKTVTDWLSKQTVYNYDDVGRLTNTQYPNSMATDYTYDAASRLASVVNRKPGPITVSSFTYTMDSVGNRRQMVDISGTHDYVYDELHRLKEATYPGGVTDVYTYDAHGNRLKKNATNYAYNAADQMTCSWTGSPTPPCPGGSLNYGYDNNGNQTGRGSETFTYDHENRLTKITLPNTVSPEEPCYDFNGDGYVDITDMGELTGNRYGSGTGDPNYDAFYDLNSDGFIDTTDITMVGAQFGQACTSKFTYNGDGLRTARGGSYLNWKYVWDVGSGLPVILKETDSHNDLDGHGTNNTYVYGLDLISVTDRTGAQTYFAYDGLGSTANLTDDAGNTTASYSYDVFGELRSPEPSAANEFRFTGEQRDSQTGRNLYYLRARYYDPATGRFLSQDPIRAGHPYAYVGNNPLNFSDPTGLHCRPFSHPHHCGDEIKCISNPIEQIRCAAGAIAGHLPECGLPVVRTCQLAATCLDDTWECIQAREIGSKAEKLTEDLFDCPPHPRSCEGTFKRPLPYDQFQHCYWSGSLALSMGASLAWKITSRYEAWPGNDPQEKPYDLYNNARGIGFAEELKGNPQAKSLLQQRCKE